MKDPQFKLMEDPRWSLLRDRDSGAVFYIKTDSGFVQADAVDLVCDKDIYKKLEDNSWVDQLNGSTSNGILCHVWDGDDMQAEGSVAIIIQYNTGDSFPYETPDTTYRHATPLAKAAIEAYIERIPE